MVTPNQASARLRSARRERRRDQRQHLRHHGRAGEPLEQPGGDQFTGGLGQAAQQRGGGEADHADHEHPPVAEQVAQPAAGHHAAGVHERVTADDQLQRRVADVQVTLQGRRATFTTQMSKPAMNIAISTTGSINQRRGSGADERLVRCYPGLAFGQPPRCSITRSNSTTTVELPATLSYARSVMDDGVEPAAEDMQLPRVLAALADPHRLAAVRFVARHGESWCAQVMQEAGLELSKSTFSHHLRILREAGLVTKRIQGARATSRCARTISTAASPA